MGPKRLNVSMLLLSAAGGLIGFFAGERLLSALQGNVPNPVLIGLYYAQFAFFVCMMCLLAEIIHPVLNGQNWRRKYVPSAWLHLPLFSLLAFFIAGCILQFIYGLNIGSAKPADDIVLVIDSSGSMHETDPGNERLKAADMLVDEMTDKNRAAVIVFNQEATVRQPMVRVKDRDVKSEIKQRIDMSPSSGGTDISRALAASMRHISDTASDGRNAMVILLSDGVSEIDLEAAIASYLEKDIPIHAISMKIEDTKGSQILNEIASRTGGTFHNVDDASELKAVYHNIYKNRDIRLLNGIRSGKSHYMTVYAIMRVLFVCILGILLGAGQGLIFDNRHIVRGFVIGGVFSGLLAGLILELGLKNPMGASAAVRAVSDIVLAVVFVFFSLVVTFRNDSVSPGAGNGYRAANRGARSMTRGTGGGRSSF